MDLSIVIPVYNESSNLKELYQQIVDALKSQMNEYEVLFVDDGSTDGSFLALDELHKDTGAIIVKFDKNYGQHAALLAGMLNSSGEVVVFMDADLQNDPKYIPIMLEKIREGYDVVKGWRIDRKASLLRKFSSLVFNKLFAIIIEKELHDYGCTLGAFRREVYNNIDLRDRRVKYVQPYGIKKSEKATEIQIKDRSRLTSFTKYNFAKLINLFFELFYLFILENKLTFAKKDEPFFLIERILR